MPNDPSAEPKNVNVSAPVPSESEATAAQSPPAVAAPARHISSEELFAGAREIAIDHNGRRYQLRITQSGKLILTA